MNDTLGGIASLLFLTFTAWFFWDGDTAWNDENRFFLALSDKCNSFGICDIGELGDLTSAKLSVNKGARSVVFLDSSGRIVREAKNCTIVDKENFICQDSSDEMVDDRFVRISGHYMDHNSDLVELSPASWRLNWFGSHFTTKAATKVEEALMEFNS